MPRCVYSSGKRDTLRCAAGPPRLASPLESRVVLFRSRSPGGRGVSSVYTLYSASVVSHNGQSNARHSYSEFSVVCSGVVALPALCTLPPPTRTPHRARSQTWGGAAARRGGRGEPARPRRAASGDTRGIPLASTPLYPSRPGREMERLPFDFALSRFISTFRFAGGRSGTRMIRFCYVLVPSATALSADS